MSNNPLSNIDPLGLCPTCTQLQQHAAQLADALEHTSHVAEAISAAGYLTMGVGAAFELESAGLDSEVTISGAGVGSFYAATASVTGAVAAGLKSFASNGNPTAIANFSINQLMEKSAQLAASDIPYASYFSENIGQLAGEAAALGEPAQEACKNP